MASEADTLDGLNPHYAGIDEYRWNELVYKAKFNFEPVINEVYHLYYNNTGNIFLSLVEPSQWNYEFIGSFKYNHDNKWIKI